MRRFTACLLALILLASVSCCAAAEKDILLTEFNCKDLDRTQKFYEDVLDCREKFSLYYGDLIPEEHPERWAQMKPEEVERLRKLRDVRWIVYLEWPGDKDRFIELFNEGWMTPVMDAVAACPKRIIEG